MANSLNLMDHFGKISINSPRTLVSIAEILNDKKREFDITQHEYSADWYMGASESEFNEKLVATEEDHAFFRSRPLVHMPPYYKLTIENLRVFGYPGICVTQDDRVIYESALKFGVDWDPKRLDQFALFKDGQITPNTLLYDNKIIPASQYINATVTILPNLYDAYGHQLIEIFSNYLLMKDIETNYLYCKYNEYPFVQEAFAFLGVPKERIIPASINHQLMFKKANLILPRHHSFKAADANRAMLSEMGFDSLPQTEKIFILRKSNNSSSVNLRYIVNREELRQYLTQKGFREVHWEDLSITQKMETVYRAKFIVEDFSSGNSNTAMWARTGTKLLRIYSPAIKDTLPRTDGKYLSDKVCGMIMGENLQPPEFFNDKWRHRFEIDENFRRNNACYTVNMDKLDYVVTEMEK